MTVPFSTRLSGPYTATAGQTLFNFTWPALAAGDVQVVRQRGTAETVLTLGVDYAVLGVGVPGGGQVQLMAGALAGDKIAVLGAKPVERTTEFPGWRSIPNGAIDDALDEQVIFDQEARRQALAGLRESPFGTGFDARGLRVRNAADPVDARDLVTRTYGDTHYGGAAAEAAAADAAAALTAANHALAAVDAFDDVFLGNKSLDPLVDNDGDPLMPGVLYWNGSAKQMRVYDGTAWLPVPVGVAAFVPEVALYENLKSLVAGVWNLVAVRGRSAIADAGGGVFVWVGGDQSAYVAADPMQGIYVAPDSDPTGASGVWRRQYAGQVDALWFGATSSFAVDSTAAIQAAVNLSTTLGISLRLVGSFRVSQIVINGAADFALSAMATILGLESGSFDAVLVVKNSGNVSVFGALTVSAGWSEGYSAGVACYTDNGTQASRLSFHNVVVIGALVGWRFGRYSEPDALVSEISVLGGSLYGCRGVCEAIGSQTVVKFVGVDMISDMANGDAGWLAYPGFCVRSVGAAVIVSASELLLTQETDGTCIELRPVASTIYGHAYGQVDVSHCLIESASEHVRAHNPSGVASVVSSSGRIAIISCKGYHSQDTFPMITTAADFQGAVVLLGNRFYGPVARTHPNVLAHGLCDVWLDEMGYGHNFMPGLQACVGGVVRFSRRTILSVSNTVGQALAVNVSTVLKFQSVASSPNANRFGSNYSASSGQFTVPAGGLRDVKIDVALRTSQPSHPLDLSIYVGGAFAAPFSTMPGGAGSGFAVGSLELGDLPAGSTIDVRAVQYGAGSVCNGGSFEYFKLTAAC